MPYQREARTEGKPSLGAGAIYPIPRSEIVCKPFVIPPHWPRAYGMDVGWNRTSAIWGAKDQNSDTIYLYAEHYMGEALPTIHAAAIKARGDWIPGVIDPAARGRSSDDGEQLKATYQALGLHIDDADNSVESGIYAMWERFSTGRLKVFETLTNFLGEYMIYRRDAKGHIVKQYDHAMDAGRYLIMTGMGRAIVKPASRGFANAIGSAGGGDRTVGY